MFGLSKGLIAVIVALSIALLSSLVNIWFLNKRLDAVKEALAKETAELNSCKAKHALFVKDVKEAGEKAKLEMEEQIAKNEADTKEVIDGYQKAKTVIVRVPVYVDRLRDGKSSSGNSSGSGLSTPTGTTAGTYEPSQDALPPAERIIADCREETLKLVWLQYFEELQRGLP